MKNTELAKTSVEQYETMVSYFESNEELHSNKFKLFSKNEKDKLWNDLTEILNSTGKGPIKDSKTWRKTWTDFKYTVRCKAAKIHRSQTKTGGGEGTAEFLTALDERVLNLIGWNGAVGDTSIKEGGLLHISEEPNPLIDMSIEYIDDHTYPVLPVPNPAVEGEIELTSEFETPRSNRLPSNSSRTETHSSSHNRKRKLDETFEDVKRAVSMQNEVLTDLADTLKNILKRQNVIAEAMTRIANSIEYLCNKTK